MAVWTPQIGPQTEAITATWCDELFFGGARGGGKSDYLLADFLQDVGRYGNHWQGILFRRTYPELQYLVLRSMQIFPQAGGTWNEQAKEWRWKNGACLRMRYLERVQDATRYQGQQFTWIGCDELSQWASDNAYKMLKACLRWTEAEIPTKRIRATGNPGGAGHQWVKAYFIDEAPQGYKPIKDPQTGMRKMFIPSRIEDNKILLLRDPDYINRLRGVGSPELVRAWLEGDWNVVTGAYFPEFGQRHVIQPFIIPSWWTKFRAMDWGSARPFSVGWYGVSDGTPVFIQGRERIFPRGALIRYREWYGCKEPNVGLKMTAESVAEQIGRRSSGETYAYSVSDPACFQEDGGPSIAERMRLKGVSFRPGDNKRLPGWDQVRQRLQGVDGSPMLYVFNTCPHLIRTLPAAQHDEVKPEDLDSDGEDHALDELRYACMSRSISAEKPKNKNLVTGYRELTLDELYKLEERRRLAY